MNRPALLLITALMLILCPIFVVAVEDVDQEMKKNTLVEVGQTAPDFTCKTTDNRTITLSSLKGKAVVLYFFSTSVGACITEMQYMEKEIYQKLVNRNDFQLIAIGRGHSREELVKIGGENKITFSLVPDPKHELYQRYFTKFVPRTVVVRKDGSIAYLASGIRESASIADLQAALQVVLR